MFLSSVGDFRSTPALFYMESVMYWIGFAAAFCTTFAFVPQVVKTWRSRDTSGISLQCM